MGHSEHFEFVDYRVGACGVAYVAATQPEISALAEKVGYSGGFKQVVKAYPPCPSIETLKERALREDLEDDDTIPW